MEQRIGGQLELNHTKTRTDATFAGHRWGRKVKPQPEKFETRTAIK